MKPFLCLKKIERSFQGSKNIHEHELIVSYGLSLCCNFENLQIKVPKTKEKTRTDRHGFRFPSYLMLYVFYSVELDDVFHVPHKS